jgi:hypothetical protein
LTGVTGPPGARSAIPPTFVNCNMGNATFNLYFNQ